MTEAPQIVSEHRMAVYLLDSLGDIHKLRWQDEVGQRSADFSFS